MKELIQENRENGVQVDKLSFEEAYKQLETIVTALETEEKPLEDTLALFEHGQELARHCAELLDRAELKVKLLSGDTVIDFKQTSES